MKNSELIMHLFFSSLVQTWIRTGTLYLMLLYTCTVYCMGSLGNATCVRIGNYHLVLRVSNNTNCIQRPQFCQSAFASRLLCAISDEVAQHLVYFPCRPENYRKSTRRADSLIRKIRVHVFSYFLTVPGQWMHEHSLIKQAQRRDAAGRSRHKSHGVIQY